ncbi:hypothetical protein [Streptomyces sp. NPDC102283]|uniref:hypothetical protein n=1 Tax=Streptomyces sp. NPDC102283 TaxID=3366155 RepID=UPI0037F9C0AA
MNIVLAVVPCVLAEPAWLTAHQQVRLLAVASVATGTVRLLADDPGTALALGVARMCAVLDPCDGAGQSALTDGYRAQPRI